jgi:hypothetical protein
VEKPGRDVVWAEVPGRGIWNPGVVAGGFLPGFFENIFGGFFSVPEFFSNRK